MKRYVAGNEVTYADFITYWILKIFNLYDSSLLRGFPKVFKYFDDFSSLKGIKTAEEKYSDITPFPMMCAW